jgi:hypothetical protein
LGRRGILAIRSMFELPTTQILGTLIEALPVSHVA